jgi:radical SAM superfamily enzyme YgiQ (UPF0313 family)
MNNTPPRLLLINPVSRYRSGLAHPDADKTPPLCLGIIAALTPPPWKTRILDENYQTFRYREADLVGITAYTPNAFRAYEIAQFYREKNIPVIMGGIHASMCTEEALRYVDAVVVGEAENVWATLLADFEAGRLQKVYHGTFTEMNNQPIPRHDLQYPLYYWRSVQTSRGCPMNCDFCSVTSFNGGRFRMRPVEEVLNELQAFHGDKRNVFFVDDNIGGINQHHRERAKELFRGIIDRKMKFNWFSQTSVDFADDPEALKLAAASGCRLLLVGFETESAEGLKSANKKNNLRHGAENYRQILTTFHKHGIGVLGTFIFGMETDHPHDITNRAKFISRLNVDCIQTSMLTPYPGTKLSRRLSEENRLTCENFPHDWQFFNWEDIVIRHPHIDAEDLAKRMTEGWKLMYDPKRICVRFLKTLYNTKSLETAIWSMAANFQYRRIMLERPIHYCTPRNP